MIILKNLGAHWIELLLSFWVALIFVERLIVDLATVKHVPRQKEVAAEWRPLLRKAFADRMVYAFFALSFPLLSLALLLNRPRIDFLLAFLRTVREHIWGSIIDAILLSFLYFLVQLYRKPHSSKTIGKVVQEWFGEVWKHSEEPIVLVASLLVAFLLSALLGILAAHLGEDPRIREAILSWATGNVFITANTLLYFLIYRWSIAPSVSEEKRLWFWAGFAKDTTIYALAALFIANGLSRFRYALRFMVARDMWVTFAMFAMPTIFFAIIAIAMDLWYIGASPKSHSLLTEYPGIGPRTIMHFHIYLRLICLFTIPLLLWFGYLAVEIANAAQN